MKRSALNATHRGLGATMMNSAGWDIPGFYTDPVQEHHVVRNQAGLTDFSSMGEIDIKGPDAARFVDSLVVNHTGTVPIGRVVYTTMLAHDGKVLDDLTVYRLGEQHFMAVTSTAKHDNSWEWVNAQARGLKIYLTDVSAGTTLLCLQGPASRNILSKVAAGVDLAKLDYFWCASGTVAGIPTLVSRTGFTGELGYELYHPSQWAVRLWDSLLEAGKDDGLSPVGVRPCSATLRLEKAYMAGGDLEGSTPLELPLAWTVRLEKADFIGKAALVKQKTEGLTRKLVGFEVTGGIPKPGAEIRKDGQAIGRVTSAGFGPSVKKNIALGFVPVAQARVGLSFEAVSDNAAFPMTVVPVPFYDPKGERVRS